MNSTANRKTETNMKEKKNGLQRAQNYQRIIELKADEQIQ